MNPQKYKILIMGMGNLIMSDDGLGIHLIRELQEILWEEKNNINISSGDISLKEEIYSEEIFLLEIGTSPLNYLEEISQTEKLIMIDAIKGGEKSGNIYKLKEDDFNFNINYKPDFHGYSVLQVIELAREITNLPYSFTIYGIEPENINLGDKLSKKVKTSFPKLIKLILQEIKSI